MNILHVICAPAAGGAEVYVKDLSRRMVERGHEVHVGFLERARDTGRSVDFEQKFLAELEASGVNHFFIGHESRKKPWLGMLRTRKYVRDRGIDIYHSHLTYGVVFGALLGVPRLYTHHNAEMRVSRPMFMVLSPMIDHLIGISEVCTKSLSDFSRRPVTTIFNGVDGEKLSRESLTPRRLRDPIECISVGRICEQKNFELLVSAIALLPAELRSRLSVAIAGEGSKTDTEKLVAHIAAEHLEGSIRLLGNRNDIPALLAQAHLFLMSSAYEGLPIALIEAALTGLPCVVTDVGGCGEVTELCQNGIAAEPANPQALASAIARVISCPSQFTQYSMNALRLSSVFSIGHACTAHLELYETTLRTEGSFAL